MMIELYMFTYMYLFLFLSIEVEKELEKTVEIKKPIPRKRHTERTDSVEKVKNAGNVLN